MVKDFDVLVGELTKSPRQTLKISLRTYKGRRFVDIRTFSPLVEGGEPKPTARGVSVSPEMWPRFREVLARVDQALCEKGWLDWEDLGGD
ncbi:MAG: transcriptional coactivator p15/PC4 family protein [Syntrophobacterales bacterium]|nr:transcriptional coactivator p15/PC4 family protein [Syntrophobacterales bacterium]